MNQKTFSGQSCISVSSFSFLLLSSSSYNSLHFSWIVGSSDKCLLFAKGVWKSFSCFLWNKCAALLNSMLFHIYISSSLKLSLKMLGRILHPISDGYYYGHFSACEWFFFSVRYVSPFQDYQRMKFALFFYIY